MFVLISNCLDGFTFDDHCEMADVPMKITNWLVKTVEELIGKSKLIRRVSLTSSSYVLISTFLSAWRDSLYVSPMKRCDGAESLAWSRSGLSSPPSSIRAVNLPVQHVLLHQLYRGWVVASRRSTRTSLCLVT